MVEAKERGIYMQCTCIAHQQLALDHSLNYKRGLRQLLRTAQPLQNDTGLHFAQALLDILFDHLGKPNFVVQKSGSLDGVNYVLWSNDTEYWFRGYPDFSIHYESDTIADRILVIMGEIQSTRDPATQNAIYAVGNLVNTTRKELLVLTIFKNKSASTSVARLKDVPPPNPLKSIGVVTLKYFISPSPLDLTTVSGVQELTHRLNIYTTPVV